MLDRIKAIHMKNDVATRCPRKLHIEQDQRVNCPHSGIYTSMLSTDNVKTNEIKSLLVRGSQPKGRDHTQTTAVGGFLEKRVQVA